LRHLRPTPIAFALSILAITVALVQLSAPRATVAAPSQPPIAQPVNADHQAHTP
jgi:hypothetical protein